MLHFSHVALFSCCTFFILHHFHVALFCVVIFSCCTFSMLHSFYVLHYFMSHFCTLQCFHFAFFSCCTLRMLQVFPVALCSCSTISRGVARTLRNIQDGDFGTIINRTVKYCCKALHLRCSWGSWLGLYYFHAALF